MQSLYKIIKAPETTGDELITLPDMQSIYERNNSSKLNKIDMEPKEDTSYDELLINAQNRAKEIITLAERKAQELIQSSIKQIEDQKKAAQEVGYQEGYKLGYSDGYQYGITEANNEAEEIRKNADIYIESSRITSDQYIKNKEKEIIELALEISKQIIQSEIMMNHEVVSKIAERVLSQATDRTHIILKVNPYDFNIIKNKKEDLSIYVEKPNNLFIIADSNVTIGSVKAETTSGFVDGDIEEQLEMIKKTLIRD